MVNDVGPVCICTEGALASSAGAISDGEGVSSGCKGCDSPAYTGETDVGIGAASGEFCRST